MAQDNEALSDDMGDMWPYDKISIYEHPKITDSTDWTDKRTVDQHQQNGKLMLTPWRWNSDHLVNIYVVASSSLNMV